MSGTVGHLITVGEGFGPGYFWPGSPLLLPTSADFCFSPRKLLLAYNGTPKNSEEGGLMIHY